MNDVALALINMVQVVVLAYIAFRQATVKRDLERYNGTVEQKLADIHSDIR